MITNVLPPFYGSQCILRSPGGSFITTTERGQWWWWETRHSCCSWLARSTLHQIHWI